jgi:S1-C subfamily serine protease
MDHALQQHRQRTDSTGPKKREQPIFVRKLPAARNYTGCIHCHQAKEILYEQLRADGKWSRELLFRYPLPDNLGIILEVDRGNVVKRIEAGSAAAQAGLLTGDVLQKLNGLPVHSLADAQYALDRAPQQGTVSSSWLRANEVFNAKIVLTAGWRRSDITWRPSMYDMIGAARVYGEDLTASEKQSLGLPLEKLAFRQKDKVATQARLAGIKPGDIILGFDGERLELDAYNFLRHVRANYVVGDEVIVNLIRAGKRMDLPMTLQRN